ncbi:MAG: TolC family protein, partial [Pseudomonadota bacterium]
MFRLRTGFHSGAAVCLFLLANTAPSNAAVTPENPKYYGSIYPEDTVEPVSSSPPPVPTRTLADIDEDIARALGAAGYLVSEASASAEFNTAIRRAVGRHPAYHAQTLTLEESGAERRRARAALYPQLSTQLRGDYSITRDFAPTTDNVVESLRPREQFTAGVSASQLVFDGGATINRIRSARALSEEYRNALSTR